MKVMRFEPTSWDRTWKERFLEDFPFALWGVAKSYDFALVAFGEDNRMYGYMTVKGMEPDNSKTGLGRDTVAFICFGAIDPRLRNLKVGFQANVAAIEYLARDFKKIRFLTAAKNSAMNALAKKLKFELTDELLYNGEPHYEYILNVRT